MFSESSEKWIDTRNVLDQYKHLTTEQIKEELQKTCFPFAALMENWKGDYNFSTLVRNANAFNAKEAFYISNKKGYDKRGAVGTYNYTPVTYLNDYPELEKLKDKYSLIGIDNVPGSVSVESFEWPENTLMIFGEEGTGLTKEMQEKCEKIVHITQYGSVRSLNAGCASAVVFYDYIRKFTGKI